MQISLYIVFMRAFPKKNILGKNIWNLFLLSNKRNFFSNKNPERKKVDWVRVTWHFSVGDDYSKMSVIKRWKDKKKYFVFLIWQLLFKVLLRKKQRSPSLHFKLNYCNLSKVKKNHKKSNFIEKDLNWVVKVSSVKHVRLFNVSSMSVFKGNFDKLNFSCDFTFDK